MNKEIYLNDENATATLASSLASLLVIEDVIAIYGDLGVGKTAFTRHLIHNLIGHNNDQVTSPTFNLVQLYETQKGTVWHFDLMRLANKHDVYELAIEEAFNFGISVIEWPGIIEDILPKDRLELHFYFADAGASVQDISSCRRGVIIKAFGKWCERILLLNRNL